MSFTDLDVKSVTAADGSTTTFAINFVFQDNAEVVVYLVSGSTETRLTNPGDFTVSGSNVVFGVPPVAPNNVVIIRETIKNQPTDLQNAGPLVLENIEKRLDVLTQQAQEIDEELSRGIRLQRSSSLSDLVLPAPEAGKTLGWDSAGTALENKTLTLTGAALASQAEAEAGTQATNYMSALRTKQSFDYFMDRHVLETVEKTATFTALTTKEVYFCNASSGAIVVNLPAVSGLTGKRYTIKKTGTDFNIITLDPSGAELIEASSTVIMRTPGESITIINDGTVWRIIERKGSETLGDLTSVLSWLTGVSSSEFNYIRNASFLKLWGKITMSGAVTSASLTLTLPNSWAMKADLFDANAGLPLGKCTIWDNNVTTAYSGILEAASTTALLFKYELNTAVETVDVTQAAPQTFAASDVIYFWAEMPMDAWID